MAVIYLQPDQRPQLYGQGIGNIIGAIIKHFRDQSAIQDVTQAASDPNATADQLVKAAGSSEAGQNALRNILAVRQRQDMENMQKAQIQEIEQNRKFREVETQHMQLQDSLFPLQQRREELQNKLAEYNLREQPLKDALAIRKTTADLALIDSEIKEKNVAVAAMQGILSQRDSQSGGATIESPAEPKLATPLAGFGQPYDLANDTLAKSVRAGEKFMTEAVKPKMSVTVGGIHVAEPGPGPPINERVQEHISSDLFMSQTFKSLLDTIDKSYVDPKSKKLVLGPVVGPANEFLTRMRNDPKSLQDPNILVNSLFGHERIGIASTDIATRFSAAIYRAFDPLLAGNADSKPVAITKLIQLGKLLRDRTATLNDTLVRTRAQGYDVEPFKEIQQNLDEVLTYTGPGMSTTGPRVGGVGGAPGARGTEDPALADPLGLGQQ